MRLSTPSTATILQSCNSALDYFIVQLTEDEVIKTHFYPDGTVAQTADTIMALLGNVFVDRIMSNLLAPGS